MQDSNLFSSDPGKIEFRAGANPIRHVIYILKENRTYDQILGDLKVNGVRVGNGDPFGRVLGPGRALARSALILVPPPERDWRKARR